MRVVLASSERFAGCLADSLARAGHEVVAVISPARGLYRVAYRGTRFLFYHMRGWDIVGYCRRRKIEVRVSRNLDEGAMRRFLRGLEADLLVLFSWPTLVSSETCGLFTHGGLNIHPSLLPEHRGADPLFSIIDGDLPGFGLSFHKVIDELDAGPLYLQVPLHRAPEDTYDVLYLKVLEGAYRFLPKAIASLEANPAGKPQEGAPSRVGRFQREMSILDPSAPLAENIRRTLACRSHHARVTACAGRVLTFQTLRVLPTTGNPRGDRTVVRIGTFSIDVVLSGQVVRLGKLRFFGKPRWATPALLRLDLRTGQMIEDAATVKDLLAN